MRHPWVVLALCTGCELRKHEDEDAGGQLLATIDCGAEQCFD